MPQESNGQSGEGPGQKKPDKFFDARLGVIFLIALVVFGFFVCLYKFDRNPSKGLQLLTANTLSLLVLVVIAVQAHIYDRQRKHMEEHLGAMREQLEIMERSIEVAQENTVYAQRAYISVILNKVEEPGVFHLRLENSGNSPAYDVVVKYNAGFDPPDWKRLDFRQEPVLIGPRQGYDLSPFRTEGLSSQRGEFYRARAGISCWGIIEYRDIFKEPLRHTPFRFDQFRSREGGDIETRPHPCPDQKAD